MARASCGVGVMSYDEISDNTARWEKSVAHLRDLAGKRFWTLEADKDNPSRFSVKDPLGRVLYGPAFPMSVRGFFQNLPEQA